MSSGDFNLLHLRNLKMYTPEGSYPAVSSIFTIGTEGAPVYTNDVAIRNAVVSTLTGSTLTASTAMLSTLNVGSQLGFSTMVGSSLTASTATLSTLNVGSQLGFSTMVGSSLTASTATLSTLGVSARLDVSTLTASTVSTNLLTTSDIQLQSSVVALGLSTTSTQLHFSGGSYDAGSWALAKSGVSTARKLAVSSTGQYQVVVSGATTDLYLSSDSGVTWTGLTTASCGLPTLTGAAYWSSGSISASGQHILLGVYGGSLWMSSDYGRTFALTEQPTPDIWLQLNGSTVDTMGASTVTAFGSPSYAPVERPGYSGQAIQLANTAGGTAERYVRGSWNRSDDFTISFWFNAQTLGIQQQIFSAQQTITQFAINSSNQIVWQYPTAGNVAAMATPYGITSNTWYYVTSTFQANGTCALYVNNTLVGSVSNTGGFGSYPTNNLFSIGTYDVNETTAFNGLLADLRIHNSAIPYVPIPLLAPNIWLPFESSTVDAGSQSANQTSSTIYLPFEGTVADQMGFSSVTATGSPGYVAANRAGYSGQAVNLANTAGGTATQYVRGSWSGSPSGNFSVSFWFNPQTLNGTQQTIFSAYSLFFIIAFDTSNRLYVNVPTGGGSNFQTIAFTGALSTNTWYYVTVIFQTNSLCSFYVNNSLIGSITNSQGVGTLTSSQFSLGTFDTALTEAYNGLIDDFRIYNYAITYRPVSLMTVTGSLPYVPGVVGLNAVSLANTAGGTADNYVRGACPAIGSDITLSCWVNVQSIPTSTEYQVIFGMYTAAIHIYIDNKDTIFVRFPSGSGTGALIISTKYSLNTWYHIYMIFRVNGTCSFYLNGALINNVTNSGGYGTYPSTGLFSIGTYENATTLAFNGYIDDFRIYNAAIPFHVLNAPQNYRSVALSGTGQYALASAASGWVLGSTDSGETWVKEAVSVGTQGDIVQPNKSGLSVPQWEKDGVNYVVSASSVLSGYTSHGLFDNIYPGVVDTSQWASNMLYVNGNYDGSVSTSIQGFNEPVLGEWFQLQVSTPLILQSYRYATQEPINATQIYYIVGSNDGATWYPLQYMLMSSSPFTIASVTMRSDILINYSGVQTVLGNVTGSGISTSYITSTTPYLYFRIITTKIYAGTAVVFTEFFPNFAKPSPTSLSLSHDGKYQLVASGPATSGTIMPNQSGLVSNTWSQSGVTWGASASSTTPGYPVYRIYTNTPSDAWLCDVGVYNTTTGAYASSKSTTVLGGVGSIPGEWVQLQSSVPLVLSSYTYGDGGAVANIPRTYYIVGSNDGSNWYPLQYVDMSVNPFTSSTYTSASTYITVNTTGPITIQGNVIGQGLSTAYSFTTQPYMYFRMIISAVWPNTAGYCEFTEWYMNFTNAHSYSADFGNSWQTQSSTLSNELVALSPSGQVAVSTNCVAPLARLTLDNTAADAQGALVPAAGAGTVSYSTSVVKVGSHSAVFSNAAGAAPSNYLNYTVPAVLSQPPALTMGCWVYPVALPTFNNAVPISFNNGTTTPGPFLTVNPSGSIGVAVYNTITSSASVTSSTIIAINTWSHLLMTYSANVLSLYVNGVLQGTSAFSGNLALFSGGALTNFFVGGWKTDTNGFSGHVDDVRLYTSALSADEVLALYKNPALTQSVGVSNSYLPIAATTSAVEPLARLPLDGSAADTQGALTPATGAGAVQYSSSVVRVGTQSAFFGNVAGSTSPTNYLNYTVPAVLNTPSALTMSCWVYPTAIPVSGNSVPLSFNDGVTTSGPLFIINSISNIQLGFPTTTSGYAFITSSSTVSINNWYHLSATFSNGLSTLYVNGISQGSSSYTGILSLQGGGVITKLFIGAQQIFFGAFNGYVDDVRLYTSALTPAQVLDLYQNPNQIPPKYTLPVLPSASSNVVDVDMSETGQSIVAVTGSTTNNVFYSTDSGATFTSLSIGSSAMVSCAMSYDGMYFTVTNAVGAVYTLNRNSLGYTIAIGSEAGALNQGQNAIAIGEKAGLVNQAANSIVLNATGSALNATGAGLYAAPVDAADPIESTRLDVLGYGSDSQIVKTGLTMDTATRVLSEVKTESLSVLSTSIALGENATSSMVNASEGSIAASEWVLAKSDVRNVRKLGASSSGQHQIVVGGGSSDLWMSSDSGVSWSRLGFSTGLPQLTGSAYWSSASISSSGQHILLGIYGGSLWMSQDSGRTFSLSAQATPNIWILAENSSVGDVMGSSTVSVVGAPSYVSVNRPGYTSQAVNLANSLGAGVSATRYLRGTWSDTMLQNWTVSFWFNMQSYDTSQGQSILFSTAGNSLLIIMYNNSLSVYAPNKGVSAIQISTSSQPSLNTWHYVTYIHQVNGICSLYLNNILIGTYTNLDGLFETNSLFSIGTYDRYSTTFPFNGYIDDLRITNSALPYVPIPLLAPNIWMPFENSVTDLGSNAIVPTVTGSLSYVPGVVGLNAVNLVNAPGNPTNYITMSYSIGTNFTVSFWLNFQTEPISTTQIPVAFRSGGTPVVDIGHDSTRGFAQFYTDPSTVQTLEMGKLSINTWYHIAFIYQQGGTSSLYLNGQFVTSIINSPAIFLSPTTIDIAHRPASGASFNGYIDDFRIYNAAIPYHALVPQNYKSVALAGTGAYALASSAAGWVLGSTDSLKTWSKQSVCVGTQGDVIQPNKTGLASSQWEQNGVNWVVSASSTFGALGAAPYGAFNNYTSASTPYGWISGVAYNDLTGAYTGSKTTTVSGGVGTVSGEWLQLQGSIPIVLTSYTIASGFIGAQVPSSLFIVGSMDGSNWSPIQSYVFTANPYTATAQAQYPSNYLLANYTGSQTLSIAGVPSQSGIFTSYATSTNSYTYFRFIARALWANSTVSNTAEFGELYLNFARSSPTSLALSSSGQYQMVATGSAAGNVMPNQTGLASSTWSQGGVTWGTSASSTISILYPYGAFNNYFGNVGTYSWASNTDRYNTSSGLYIYSPAVTTTVQGGIGAVVGEWLQLQSSVPLVLTSYTYGCGGYMNLPKTYYIVGSMDGSNWYPLQYVAMTTNPLNGANNSVCTSYITTNTTGAFTILGAVTGAGTSTAYSYTTQPWMYFRIITLNIWNMVANAGAVEIGELYLNFSNSLTYSTNYGATWSNQSNVVSNEIVSLSGSGQVALSTNCVAPLARLTLDGSAVDAQGVLVPATGAGTVTYSSAIKKVGSHSAFFNNTPGGNPDNYLNYTVPAVLNTPPALTMGCWIYLTALPASNWASPLGFNSGSASGYGPNLGIYPNGVCLAQLYGPSGNMFVLSTSTVSINTWAHLALTSSAGSATLYLNGIAQSTVSLSSIGGSLSATGGAAITNLFVGGLTSNYGAFNGHIDDVRLYTTALSADEVVSLYANPALTQSVGVSSSYLPITSYVKPVLPGATANVVDAKVSQTGQYMVAVTSSGINNVFYSMDSGATFSSLTIGASPMTACSMSADGSYLTVSNILGAVYTLNRNSTGYTVAVGASAGAVNQGAHSIAIGNGAGAVNQSANSIVLNASGSALGTGASGFYVSPIGTTAGLPMDLLGYGSDSQVVRTGVTVLPGGNVGIGTTNPVGSLTVLSSPTYINANPELDSTRATNLNISRIVPNGNRALYLGQYVGRITFSGADYSWNAQKVGAEINTVVSAVEMSGASLDLCFNTLTNTTDSNPSEKMRITRTGNVGIGTTNPEGKFHVYGTDQPLISIGRESAMYNTAQITYTHIGNSSVYNYGSLQMNSQGAILNWTASGNVGIGTTNPSTLLQVAGAVSSYPYTFNYDAGNTVWTIATSTIPVGMYLLTISSQVDIYGSYIINRLANLITGLSPSNFINAFTIDTNISVTFGSPSAQAVYLNFLRLN